MEKISALFKSRKELTSALTDLNENGFDMFTVFGPEDLFGAPEPVEEELESAKHMAAGTVSGISVNPRPYAGDGGRPDARPVTEELQEMGLTSKTADYLAAGLQQERLALIVGAKAGRQEEAREILRNHGAFMLFSESSGSDDRF